MKAKSKGISQTVLVFSILSLAAVNLVSLNKISGLEKQLNSTNTGGISKGELNVLAGSRIDPLWEIVSAHQKWLELNGSNLKEINDLVNKNFEEIFTIIEKQRNALSGS